MTKPLLIAATLLLALLAAACGDPTSTPPADPDPDVATPTPTASAPDPDGRTDPDAAVTGMQQFAVDLYHAFVADAPNDNLVFSPYVIAVPLAMVRAGAAGNTAAQIDAALHAEGLDLPTSLAPLAEALAARSGPRTQFDGTEVELALRSANALWGQEGTPFRDPFLATLRDRFGSPLRPIDFAADPQAAADAINQWVADQTEDRIPMLVGPDVIDRATRFVLASAIYLDAPWAMPFADSGEQAFYPLRGEPKLVPFMEVEADLRYVASDGYEAVAVPYAGGELDMVLILPDDGRFDEEGTSLDLFAEAETRLDLGVLTRDLGAAAPQPVRLWMPPFAFSSRPELKPALQALGIRDAFRPGQADLAGIVAPSDQDGPLFVGSALHQALIDVDREGTVAAAATEMGGDSVEFRPGPIFLVLDRPFLFLIRDAQTHTPLFLGRVMDPSVQAD